MHERDITTPFPPNVAVSKCVAYDLLAASEPDAFDASGDEFSRATVSVDSMAVFLHLCKSGDPDRLQKALAMVSKHVVNADPGRPGPSLKCSTMQAAYWQRPRANPALVPTFKAGKDRTPVDAKSKAKGRAGRLSYASPTTYDQQPSRKSMTATIGSYPSLADVASPDKSLPRSPLTTRAQRDAARVASPPARRLHDPLPEREALEPMQALASIGDRAAASRTPSPAHQDPGQNPLPDASAVLDEEEAEAGEENAGEDACITVKYRVQPPKRKTPVPDALHVRGVASASSHVQAGAAGSHPVNRLPNGAGPLPGRGKPGNGGNPNGGVVVRPARKDARSRGEVARSPHGSETSLGSWAGSLGADADAGFHLRSALDMHTPQASQPTPRGHQNRISKSKRKIRATPARAAHKHSPETETVGLPRQTAGSKSSRAFAPPASLSPPAPAESQPARAAPPARASPARAAARPSPSLSLSPLPRKQASSLGSYTGNTAISFEAEWSPICGEEDAPSAATTTSGQVREHASEQANEQVSERRRTKAASPSRVTSERTLYRHPPLKPTVGLLEAHQHPIQLMLSKHQAAEARAEERRAHELARAEAAMSERRRQKAEQEEELAAREALLQSQRRAALGEVCRLRAQRSATSVVDDDAHSAATPDREQVRARRRELAQGRREIIKTLERTLAHARVEARPSVRELAGAPSPPRQIPPVCPTRVMPILAVPAPPRPPLHLESVPGPTLHALDCLQASSDAKAAPQRVEVDGRVRSGSECRANPSKHDGSHALPGVDYIPRKEPQLAHLAIVPPNFIRKKFTPASTETSQLSSRGAQHMPNASSIQSASPFGQRADEAHQLKAPTHQPQVLRLSEDSGEATTFQMDARGDERMRYSGLDEEKLPPWMPLRASNRLVRSLDANTQAYIHSSLAGQREINSKHNLRLYDHKDEFDVLVKKYVNRARSLSEPAEEIRSLISHQPRPRNKFHVLSVDSVQSEHKHG